MTNLFRDYLYGNFPDPNKKIEELGDKLEGISDAYAGIPCKNLEMVPNDSSKALSNYNILLAAVKQGQKILVDNVYYIQSPYTVADSNTLVNYDISIVGNNPTKSKLISLGGRLFNAKGKVFVENVTLDCTAPSLTYLFSFVAPFRTEITFKNTKATGNIRLLDSSIPINYDYVQNDCGITKLTMKGNDFKDVYNSSGSRYICKLNDTPITEGYVTDNEVKDFSYVFLYNGISNGNTSTNYIYNNCEKFYIARNTVINGDDYDPTVKNGGYQGGYFCFALIEAYNVECRDNTFEGIHIFDAPNTVVYDNYFSVTELIYENNMWKNNVNFTPNIQYVDLMKSKMGGTGDGSLLTRNYRKNTYIVEKSYAEKFGKDPFLLRKQIDTYQEWIDKVIIEDNFFDLYTLSFNRFKYAKDYTFNKNTINVYTVENSVNTQAYIGIVDYKKDGVNVPRTMIFSNNNIDVKNPPTGSALGTLESALIRNYSGNGDKVKVIFENNFLNSYEIKYILSDERTEAEITNNPCIADIRFNNNTVDIKKTSHVYIMQKSFKKLNSFKNNEINVTVDSPNSLNVFYEPSTVAGTTRYALPLCLGTELDLQFKGDQWLRILPLKGLMDSNYKVTMDIKILSDTTLEEFTINFTLRNDGTNNIVDCMGQNVLTGESTFTQKSYVLDGVANKVYSNFYIQQENFKGTSTVNVNISNSSTAKEIMLQSKAPRATFNNDRVKIKMTISKV